MTPIVFSSSDPLRAAAESFVARLRRGERPTLAEYAERLPDQAGRIREIFPRLLAAERRAGDDQTTGPFGPVEDQDNTPKAIGDYVIVREIGRGGMGIVYEAVQASLGRQVALKVLPSGPCSRGPFLERFRREARAAARLHHTNIVPVFGTGEADGVHYYAMQYIEGMGLDAVLKEFRRRRGLVPSQSNNATKTVNIKTRGEGGTIHIEDFELGPASILPTLDGDVESVDGMTVPGKGLLELVELSGINYYRSIARLGVQAAEAVAYAHLQGVLHRDIKPSNFLLDRHGILWITDFGLAKADGDDMTGTGDIVGTLRYMAPERFQAKSDARSDVYALGMTLYEMIALRPAFEEEDRLKLVDRINRERPARLRNFDPTVPRDLETIILKSIQKGPDHRYVSAAEMADDLRRFLTDRPITARRASILEETRRWCRRNRSVTGLIGLVLLMWILLVAVVVYANFQLRNERDQVLNQSKRADSEKQFAQDRRWHSEVTLAQLRRTLRKPGQRFDAIDALVEAQRIRPDPVLTSHAIASLALADVRRIHAWEGWPAGSLAVDFDSALERYARTDGEGRTSVRAVIGDVEQSSLPGINGPSTPKFSRNDQFLAVWHQRDGALVVWRLSSDAPRDVIKEASNTTCFDFSANDQFFATGRINGNIAIHELAKGTTLRTIDLGAAPRCLTFHPKEPTLAVAIGNEVLFVIATTGEVKGRSTAPAPVTQLAWHPDGRHWAAATNDGHIHLFSEPGSTSNSTLQGHRGGPALIAYHPDGSALASAGPDNTLRFWDAINGRLLMTSPTRIGALRLNRDGRRMAAEIEGNRLGIMEVASGREYRTLIRRDIQKQTTFHDGAVSPDGQILAVGTSDGLTLWNLANSEELVTLPLGDTSGCLFLSNQELLTSGAKGVFAWSIQTNQNGVYNIGPPRLISTGPTERLARSRDGTVVAVAAKAQGALVLFLDRPTIRSSLLSHEAATFLSLSPDGSRIATGTQDGSMIRIWDAQSNRLVTELPIRAGSDVSFSPDGRWLATNLEGDGVQLWATTNWTKDVKRRLDAAKQSRLAFSPDGRLVVAESGTGSLLIYQTEPNHQTERCELVAELEDPNRDRASWLTFSPEGGRLIAACNDSQTIHVWDLANIRDGLTIRGLEGNNFPIFDRPLVRPTAKTVQVVGESLVDPISQARWAIAMSTLRLLAQPDIANEYCRRGAAMSELGLSNLAVQDFSRAIALEPSHAESHYRRGLEFFQLRQWEPALEDFGRAQERLALERPALADLARWMRGKVMLQLDRVEEMMNDVNSLLNNYPNDPQLYYQRALGHVYRGRYASAVSDLHLALRFGPTNDLALNNLAWILVAGPAEWRDVGRGFGYAQRAVTLAPQKATYQNTLGVALYRLGRYRESLLALDRSMQYGKGQHDGYDLYFKAMCFMHLEQPEQAKESFDKAIAWQKSTRLNPHETAELEKFRMEAQELISPNPPAIDQ